jgi:hydroxymethylglutaryl-CoA synthase
MKKIGIESYGTYIPRFRVSTEEIANAWRKNPKEIIESLGIVEKSVPGVDEDTVTLSLEAAYSAISNGGLLPGTIESLLVGSESHPYAVNPTSTIVGELLGIGNNYLAADLEFACKAATAGIQLTAGLVASGQIKKGLVIGSDTAQGKPHDALEYTSSSASAAFVIGTNPVATLLSYTSYSSDTPDFWRRDGIRYPSHAGRFTGEPAYFAHVMGCADNLIKETKIKTDKITYCVFHMPNAKFPRDVAKRLGFNPTQLAPSLIVDSIGNPYSASAILGLSAVLDIAKPGDTIFMVSYGSGAGSDGFLWLVENDIRKIQKYRKINKLMVSDQIKNKTNITYMEYLKHTDKI